MTTRRDLLLSSLFGVGALGVASLRGTPLALAAPRAASPKRVVLVTAFGGWDPVVALDPHRTGDFLDGPELDEVDTDADDVEATTTYGSSLVIGTNEARRPAVSRFFERWGDHALVVRGIDMGTISHQPARGRIVTGSRDESAPDLAALAADTHGRTTPLPYVDLGSTAQPGPFTAITARTGAIGQARFLIDRGLYLPVAGGGFLPTHRTPHAVEGPARAWMDRRTDALLDTRLHGRGARRLSGWQDAAARAEDLADDGKRLAGLLPDGLRRTFVDQANAAVSMLRDGVAWSVALDSTLDFDTHDDIADQHALHDTLFSGIDALVTGLSEADLLDDTVVLVLSEFGRTPRRNEAGGKDHWPITAALMLGGGIDGGRAWGETDSRLAGHPVDLATGVPTPGGATLRFEHLAAGLLTGLDVDPGPWVPGMEAIGGLFA